MDGETEILSHGPTSPPPRLPRAVVVAGVVAALVTGYLVGSRVDEGAPAAADAEPPGPGLVAGSVREGPDAWERVSFEVVLHNSGAVPAVVYLSRIGPVDVHRDVTRGPVRVAAGATALVDVDAPSACEHDPDAAFTTVTADVDRGEGRHREEIPLLDATALLDYLDGVCREPTTDLPTSALEGVWALEDVYGREGANEQQALLWFRPDGSFVADSVGELFTVRAGLRGRYALGLGVLRMRVDGGSWCEPGQGAVWQVHRRTSRLLDLRYLRGSCPFEPQGLWKLRLVLTSVPPGVAW